MHPTPTESDPALTSDAALASLLAGELVNCAAASTNPMRAPEIT